MAVININKNGTVIEDMSKVTVPKEIVEAVANITQKKKENGRRKKHGYVIR